MSLFKIFIRVYYKCTLITFKKGGNNMRRHVFVVRYGGDRDTYDTLEEKGFVAEKYKYSKYVDTGSLYTVTDKALNQKFMAIASNRTCRTRTVRRRRQYVTRYRVMYRLTDAGVKYVKSLILDECI